MATIGSASYADSSAPSASGVVGTFGNIQLASYEVPAAPPVQTPVADAQSAIDAAETSIAAAAKVTADIQASGLDVGTADTVVDTSALGIATEQLTHAFGLPSGFLPDFTDDVTTLTTSVDGRVAELRTALDGAIQLKAKQEAEEKARKEAEAAAAAQAEKDKAAKAQSTSSSKRTSGSTAAAPAYVAPAGEAQSIAHDMIAGYGWGEDQFSCLVSLWNRESGWRVTAANGSGAYGIPQALPGSKMASAGPNWQTDAATQIRWGLGYIAGRYGSPCGAWGHSQSTGWY